MTRTKWYQAGLHFSCIRCGACCSGVPGYVWVTKEEIRRISAYLGHSDGWLGPRYLRRVGFRYSLTEKPDGDCVFLNHTDDRIACTIYPVRPLQCRTWPFWSSNLRSSNAWNKAHIKCPGINKGELYELERIEAIRKQKRCAPV